uniref:uncharacterized protein LOC127065263 n=1 Tax=Vespula vulgaris TaxID=7454 RepID=UPI00223B98F2|nr:uncharacterized protein LOC127065263 [Vespula vulgaris]
MPGVCARCRREVYFAEERLALGKVWHTFCFSCLNCRKLLDSCTVSTHRGELFCRNCYSRLFPSILRSTKENNSSKDIKTFPRSTILNTPISVKDSTCCHCCCYCATEDTPIGEASSINSKDYHSKKHRLRGGGEEEEKSQSRLGNIIVHLIVKMKIVSAGISSTEGNHKNPINVSPTPRPCPRSSARRVSFCEEKNTVDHCCDMQNDQKVFLDDRNLDDCSKADILTIRSSEDLRKPDQDLNDEDLNYSDIVDTTQIPCHDIDKDNENIFDKDMPNCIHRNLQDFSNDIQDKNDNDDDRMRGGHGGSNCRKSRKSEGCCANISISEGYECCSSQNPNNRGCCCRKRCIEFESCSSPREHDPCDDYKNVPCKYVSCSPPCADKRGCCPPAGYRPICRKPRRNCCSPCKGESPGCGGGGCCGGGCRGGCGKPGQTCVPARQCFVPPCRLLPPCVETPCASPRPSPCCRPPSRGRCCCTGGGGSSYCRSRSPPCRTVTNGDCCCDNVTCCDIDGIDSCCKVKLPPGCECLGGGLDCQRCGRKVYQAEMQIASGVPYHNICFSCFCCRKPLEPLTYQESCGEIYCKQCYIRNFGPQGYGYGMGAGALQTPM